MNQVDKVKTLGNFISELNELSSNYKFGQLQTIRKERKPLQKVPSSVPFRLPKKVWAHHIGGHNELQFNIGEDRNMFRWGVAISLQPTQSLPEEEIKKVIFPKVRRLSDLLERYGDNLYQLGFQMWHDTEGKNQRRQRSDYRRPQQIEDHLYVSGAFIFVGKRIRYEEVDPVRVLEDFDLLLPFFEFVEYSEAEPNSLLLNLPESGFYFNAEPMGKIREDTQITRATKSSTKIVNSRHKAIQNALKLKLERDGYQVRTEHPDGRGRSIDVVACHEGDLYFYEIKTDPDPRLCVREAFGQLLEYAYRPEPIHPKHLIVVTDSQLDAHTDEYLQILRQKTGLNISHLLIEPDHVDPLHVNSNLSD